MIFWSGRVEDDGRGPVEPGAHFYKSYQLDGAGNPINKRNAWQARSVLYVKLIPPGAADVAHYRVRDSQRRQGAHQLHREAELPQVFLVLHALRVRRAAQAGAGCVAPQRVTKQPGVFLRSRQYSGERVGRNQGSCARLADRDAGRSEGQLSAWAKRIGRPVVQKQDRERWNDWGIGLLLQGDLKGAEYAFQKVTEAEPEYADGWLNVARALIQEGETDAAKPFVEKALAINPKLGRIYFFKAMVQKADGDYDGALASLRTVESMYPRDRVVLNQMARILFLKRQYAEAIKVLERVCEVDPEDLQMHYTLMLCYRGLGDREKAAREEALFRRFKAEESAQSITAIRRRLSPEDNNERQQIHDHESVALTGGGR